MTVRPRRYIFSSLEALVEGKIKKLATICEKLFLFIDEEEPVIPVKIVQKLQQFGKKIKWVPVEIDLQSDFQVFFSFFVGKTHERTAPDVEFVILGTHHQYDSLARYLNTCGRSCLRLEPSRAFELLGPGYGMLEGGEVSPVIPGEREVELPRMEEPSEAGAYGVREKPDAISGKIAREVVERMIQSGNRPSELPILREYIQLCHQDSLTTNSVDCIIEHMQERKEIMVNGGLEVVYNF